MKFVNLCPHPVTVFGNGIVPSHDLPAPEAPARTEFEDKYVAHNVKRKVVTNVVGLPPPTPWTIYVVSNVVRNALPARLDLASPIGTVEVDGKKGCRYLVTN